MKFQDIVLSIIHKMMKFVKKRRNDGSPPKRALDRAQPRSHPEALTALDRAKPRSHGQVCLGPISGEGVFLGPLGGDGVFSTLLDRMVTGQLSNVGKLDEDFNIVLTPGDLASMQGQALKTGDVEVLGLMIIMFRQLDDLFWWTVDGANF